MTLLSVTCSFFFCLIVPFLYKPCRYVLELVARASNCNCTLENKIKFKFKVNVQYCLRLEETFGFTLIETIFLAYKGWFSLAHKYNISITSENTRDMSISRNIRRTNPLIFLMLFSLLHKLKHKKNEHVCFSCAYAYAQVRTA